MLRLPGPACSTALRPSNGTNITRSLLLRPSLVPSPRISQQCRCASILGTLKDLPTAWRNKKRVGRGPSSGKGKTAGRGHKGQGQRGKKPRNFEGGQTPYHVTHPKKGYEKPSPMNKYFVPLNLDRVQQWIDAGRLDPSAEISFKELLDSRCVHGIKDGVKLLAGGKETLKQPVKMCVSRASKEAIKAIEDIGGKIVTRYFTRQSILMITHPHYFNEGQRLPDALSRRDQEYYRDPEHRGYLSHTLKKGESPSLLWKRKLNAAYFKKRTEEQTNPKESVAKVERLF